MRLERCNDQPSKTLDQFYEEIAAHDHPVDQAIGVAMLSLIRLLRLSDDLRRVWGLTSHYSLVLLAEDTYLSPWYATVRASGEQRFEIVTQSEGGEGGRREASSLDDAVALIVDAMDRAGGWDCQVGSPHRRRADGAVPRRSSSRLSGTSGPANEPPLVHVTFGASAAGSLKLALGAIGREEEVLFLADDLSFGPIDPGDVRQRTQWAVDELGFHEDAEIASRIEEFWERVIALRTEIVAWVSTRYVTEYCGLLELLWRVKDAPVSVVDVADVAFTRRDGTPSPDTSTAFACVPEEQIVQRNLISYAKRISDIEREAYQVEWERLRNENGPLRVLAASGVASAPITYFDDTILSGVTDEWQSCARVVGDALWKTSQGPFRQCSSDEFFFDRLLTLVDDEVIEGKNDQELWSLRGSWVRRRPTPKGV